VTLLVMIRHSLSQKAESCLVACAPMPPQLALVLLLLRIPANGQDTDYDDPNISEPLAMVVEGSKGALITTSRSH